MRKFLLALALLSLVAVNASEGGVPAEKALELLKQGNERFVTGKVTNDRHTVARAAETAKGGQHPFTVVLTCGDSRVPPEVIFDQGVGDIFVVRVAGNLAGAIETASIEYGVEHTGANLVVILGHTHCGAVAAALTAPADTTNPLLTAIQPVIKKLQESIDSKLIPTDLFTRLVEWGNVQAQSESLYKLSPIIQKSAASGKIKREGPDGHSASAPESFKVVLAMYDIETGAVNWPDVASTAVEVKHPAPAEEKAAEPRAAEKATNEKATNEKVTSEKATSEKATNEKAAGEKPTRTRSYARRGDTEDDDADADKSTSGRGAKAVGKDKKELQEATTDRKD